MRATKFSARVDRPQGKVYLALEQWWARGKSYRWNIGRPDRFAVDEIVLDFNFFSPLLDV